MIQVGLGGIVTVAAFVVTLMGIIYKYGKNVKKNEQVRDDLMEAHNEVHSDVERLIVTIDDHNGIDIESNKDQCDVCQRVEDD